MKLCELCKWHYRDSKVICCVGDFEIHYVRKFCNLTHAECEKIPADSCSYEFDPNILQEIAESMETVYSNLESEEEEEDGASSV